MEASAIITIMAAVGGPAGLVALVMLLPQIRKLQSDTRKVEQESDKTELDAASVLSAAALEQMRVAMERATGAEARAESAERIARQLRDQMQTLDAELRRYHEVATEHAAWDYLRIQELVECGNHPEAIPPPPPLLPPRPSIEPYPSEPTRSNL